MFEPLLPSLVAVSVPLWPVPDSRLHEWSIVLAPCCCHPSVCTYVRPALALSQSLAQSQSHPLSPFPFLVLFIRSQTCPAPRPMHSHFILPHLGNWGNHCIVQDYFITLLLHAKCLLCAEAITRPSRAQECLAHGSPSSVFAYPTLPACSMVAWEEDRPIVFMARVAGLPGVRVLSP